MDGAQAAIPAAVDIPMLLDYFKSLFATGYPALDTLLLLGCTAVITSLPFFLLQLGTIALERIQIFFQIKVYHVTLEDKRVRSKYGGWDNVDDEASNSSLLRCINEMLISKHNVSTLQFSQSTESKNDTNEYQRMKTKLYKTIPICQNLPVAEHISLSVEQNEDLEKEKSRTTSFIFSSRKGSRYIEEWLKKIYSEWVDLEFKEHDKDEGLFYLTPRAKDDGTVYFERYQFRSTKTWQTFWNEDKAKLMEVVDNFTNKQGVFAKPGTPYKLGFLLYGPPGCGKTTFIKLLANSTNRFIINVNLGVITTTSGLLDIFFKEKLRVADDDDVSYTDIPFDRRIFVLEEIDTVKIVLRRETSSAWEKNRQAKPKVEGEESEEGNDGDDKEAEPEKKDDLALVRRKAMFDKLMKDDDELTLGDLLNALDGILETHSSITILTTNHIEKLDPALIRHGRVTEKIRLGHLTLPLIAQMLAFYYDVEPHTVPGIPLAFNDIFTPAELEAICQMSPTLEEAMADILARAREKTPRANFKELAPPLPEATTAAAAAASAKAAALQRRVKRDYTVSAIPSFTPPTADSAAAGKGKAAATPAMGPMTQQERLAKQKRRAKLMASAPAPATAIDLKFMGGDNFSW